MMFLFLERKRNQKELLAQNFVLLLETARHCLKIEKQGPAARRRAPVWRGEPI